MTIPSAMPYSDELTMWTGYTEVYDKSTSTLPTQVHKQYYHAPFIYWIILATVTLFVAHRIVNEFVHRWRKKD